MNQTSSLGRRVFLAMIPANLLLLVWVWIGRLLFGSAGWMILILLYALPFLGLALLVTTLLAFLRISSPRAFTRGQARAQVAVWLGMLAAGFFLVDFGDTEDSATSAFTRVFGNSDTMLEFSGLMTFLGAVVAVGAWLVLLVLLLRRNSPDPGPANPPLPVPPGP